MNDSPEESGEFWYAYHAYHEHGILPSVFADLPKHEKAIVMAFIQIKQKEDEKQSRKMRAKTSRRR